MKTHKNMYQKSSFDNSWTYFFEQPCEYDMDDISEGDECNINLNDIHDFPFYDLLLSSSDNDIGSWR